VIRILWRGYAWSENQRHALRWIRTRRSTTATPAIVAKREYEIFVQDLATAIMAEARRQVGVRRFQSLSVVVQCTIGQAMDGQNLLKPICDAIQRSKILLNDRNIQHRTMLPDERHGSDEPDTIWLALYELREASDA
jgi:hypothetical protein